MSLVERALKKLQEQQRAVHVAPHRVGRVEVAVSATAVPADSASTIDLDAPAPELIAPEKLPVASSTPSKPARRPLPNKRIAVSVAALRTEGLLPPEHQERQIADQYRQVKRPLVTAALNRGEDAIPNAHLIMVSSAAPGDGKTFTSINLAMSMSMEKDIGVVLVDADVPKPHISRLFGVEREPGLLDALRDPAIDVETLILPTDIPNLSILPAGRWSETATELLSSRRMEALVRELGRHDEQRICLVDSPPLLLTNESRVLAQWVGQIVIVVRAGKTLQHDVQDALSHLPQGKAIGLVLNQSMATTPGYYYGYGDAERLAPP
jgi:exopolysaccharide/PEP-CTERM locus tyrosine autokinase